MKEVSRTFHAIEFRLIGLYIHVDENLSHIEIAEMGHLAEGELMIDQIIGYHT